MTTPLRRLSTSHLEGRARGSALFAGLILCVAAANAQLSSPIPESALKAPRSAASSAATQPLGSIDVPGQGAGTHGANSPIAPLVPRADVVAWSVLTDIKTYKEKTRILPAFNPAQLGLHQKTLRVQGFMLPLEVGEKQRHFLLSAVPLTCSFCVPGGPESMVEVRTKSPVKYGTEVVVVEGKFEVLNNDPQGLFYRVTNAVSVK